MTVQTQQRPQAAPPRPKATPERTKSTVRLADVRPLLLPDKKTTVTSYATVVDAVKAVDSQWREYSRYMLQEAGTDICSYQKRVFYPKVAHGTPIGVTSAKCPQGKGITAIANWHLHLSNAGPSDPDLDYLKRTGLSCYLSLSNGEIHSFDVTGKKTLVK